MRELTEQEKAHAAALEPAAREALTRHKAQEDRMKILRDDRPEEYVVTELATRLKEAQEENARLRAKLTAAQDKARDGEVACMINNAVFAFCKARGLKREGLSWFNALMKYLEERLGPVTEKEEG